MANPYWTNEQEDGEVFGATGLEAIEDGFDTVNTEMTAVEGRCTALETQDTTFDGEMTAVEGRCTALETVVASASAAELLVLDGAVAGTAVLSKAVVLDANKDYTGVRHWTITGTITANTITDGTASLAGGVGTGFTFTSPVLNGNAIGTMIQDDDAFGSAASNKLASSESIKAYVDAAVIPALTTEQVQDIAGAMFNGNTETNITVTYQDADGTIDVVVANASTTAKGVVELATTAETTTGTDATRAVTPDSLHDMTALTGAAWFLDEDAMGSNSASKVASQQSIKAYVDAQDAASATPPNASYDEKAVPPEAILSTYSDIETTTITLKNTAGAAIAVIATVEFDASSAGLATTVITKADNTIVSNEYSEYVSTTDNSVVTIIGLVTGATGSTYTVKVRAKELSGEMTVARASIVAIEVVST